MVTGRSTGSAAPSSASALGAVVLDRKDFGGPAAAQPATPVPARGSEYAVLLRRVRHAGLLDRRPRYYLAKTAAVAGAFAAGWAAFVALGESWWQLAVAAFLAAVFAQLAFLGHDAGHRQIFRTRRANYLYGLIAGNLAIGLSIGWWTSNHNRHHAHPNTEGADPDIMGILAHSDERARTGKGVRGFIFRHQGWLFFPMLLLEAGSLHYASVRAVLRWAIPNRFWEGVLLAAHAAGYLAAVFLVLSPAKAVAFVLVQQGLFGFYMGCTFAPNHKGMAVLAEDDATDFLRRQVLTSRNVRGGRVVDLALGGLNYQIEHHLFPSMPRPNLRKAQPLVARFCGEIGVPYCETNLLDSYAQALRHLHTVGRGVGGGLAREAVATGSLAGRESD
ncbi:fatty acid desaturase family protein [Nocardia tenerifensis]|uniref:fatty acid desaturase family protein n=1 Tax=Nocardia tenerifensis TaxID=228006 RepID=UPI0002EBEE6D|nr:acyl-CoA desaturase [Nocardia tenerifensis]